MSSSARVELIAVEDLATREAARLLIAEYLRWIASSAAANYGLSFDIDAMVKSDVDDRSKFYPPSGRFYVLRQRRQVRRGRLPQASCAHHRRGSKDVCSTSCAGHRRGPTSPRSAVGRCAIHRISIRPIGKPEVPFRAHALYRSVGFVEITPYAENSMKEYQPAETMDTYRSSAVFMELRFPAPRSRSLS